MAEGNSTVRYSDDELAEFKAVLEDKLANAKSQLESLQKQILDVSENTADEHGGDWVDDSSINTEMEMLNNMALRQKKYINDLNNALIRIRNKVYGICVVTGQLIDKKRLMAVPTTTKGVQAKSLQKKQTKDRSPFRMNAPSYVKNKKKED